MKKILTVSLFAVMAVSAAHAKIASVEYVDPKFQAINDEIGAVDYTGDSLSGAISALQTEVGAMSGDGGTVTTQINAAKDAAIQAAAADATSKANTAESNAKAYADGLASNYDAKGSAAQALADAKADSAAKIQALNGQTGTEAADGSYVVQTTEAGGIVTVSRQAFDATISKEQGAVHSSVTAPTTAAVATYVTDMVGVAMSEANSAQGQITEINQLIPQIQEALQDQIDAINNGETGALAQANDYTDQKVADLNGQVGSVAADGSYVVQTTEANGIVTVSRQAFDKSVSADGTDNTAPTTKAVYTAIENAKGGIDSTHAAEANKFVTGMTQVDGVITEVTKSSIDAAVVALASVPDECGANGANKCALSVKNGTFTWEIIEE